MPAICTATASPRACHHRTLTIVLDGVPYTFEDLDDAQPLTEDETRQLVSLAIRRQQLRGVSLANFLNRVCIGEEAINVRQYPLIAVGGVVTKTNIGAAYVDILPGLNGQRSLVDFTGCTQYRVILNANLVGTGTFAARVIRDSDSTVLHEATNLGAAGERELDTGWQALPGWAVSQGEVLVRVQAKSTTAADDPAFRRCLVLVK